MERDFMLSQYGTGNDGRIDSLRWFRKVERGAWKLGVDPGDGLICSSANSAPYPDDADRAPASTTVALEPKYGITPMPVVAPDIVVAPTGTHLAAGTRSIAELTPAQRYHRPPRPLLPKGLAQRFRLRHAGDRETGVTPIHSLPQTIARSFTFYFVVA